MNLAWLPYEAVSLVGIVAHYLSIRGADLEQRLVVLLTSLCISA